MQRSASLITQDYTVSPGVQSPIRLASLTQAQIVPLFTAGFRTKQINTAPYMDRNPVLAPTLSVAKVSSDFDREVYCLQGIPIDAVDMDSALSLVREAVDSHDRIFLSTPNLNFLMGCQSDAVFRESLINSDLNIIDGLPLAWMARRLGIPIRRRVTGSGLFEGLRQCPAKPGLSVYFFGGHEGVAQAACQNLNAAACGLHCVGTESPGFGSVAALSGQDTLDRINASGADFLVVSLGARKGQEWIEHNRGRLTVPVISHLGAVVNFVAGTVDRAPALVQRLGMEWLWRIKEEPSLWLRYWHDGMGMLELMGMQLLPHLLYRGFRRAGALLRPEHAVTNLVERGAECRITVSGAVPDKVPAQMREMLRAAVLLQTDVVVDLSAARHLSPAFFGLLLILRKHQAAAGKTLRFIGLSRNMRRLFRWNGVAYLLAEGATSSSVPARLAVDATSL